MNVEIHYRPSNTAAKILLEAGDSCTAEAGSMIAMSADCDVQTTTHKRDKGSLLKSVKRLFAGESFFLNHYTAKSQSEVWLSSTLSGDMIVHEQQNSTLIVQSGSFVACDNEIEVNVGWQGFKGFFSGESLFWLKLQGSGKTLLNSFGAIYEVDVEDEYVVDTGHIVAFEESLSFTISKAGTSWVSSFLGGEGLVCRFKGRGKIYCQSHNPSEFGKSLTPYLRPKKR
ncbi:MAG: TIGR00266 family protein [Bacteriovoracaceae bacterium]